MCKHIKFIFFRNNYISNVCEDIYIKIIDANLKDKLNTKVIKDNQSRLQLRKKRLFFVNEQKSLLRRDVKRYRFFSLFFSFNKNIYTKNKFDINNYIFFKRRRLLKLHLVSIY